jgi:hypothetical protein
MDSDFSASGPDKEDAFGKLFKAVSEQAAAKGEKFSFDPPPHSAKVATSQRPWTGAASVERTNYHIKGMGDLPDPLKSAGNYIVKGLINPGELSVWYGPPGAGKSFLLPYLTYRVALGLPLLGRRVKKTVVLYVVLEAANGFERRLAALKDTYGEAENFKRITQPVNLHSAQADVDGIIAAAMECGAGMIVVDTLAWAFGSGNENDSGDMGRVLAAVDRIRNETGAHVALVHHCGKDKDRGPRGHSSLKAAVSLVVEVAGEKSGRIARVEKSRDGVDGEEFAFDLKVVVLGMDDDGDQVTTCIVVPSSEPPEPRKHKLSGQLQSAYDLLVRVTNEEGQSPPAGPHFPRDKHVVPVALWREYCYQGMPGKRDKPDSVKKAFSRAFTDLKNYGYVGTWDDFVWLL